MKDIPEPTLELLSRLLGKRTAKRVYRGSLSDLFLDENVPEDVKARLRASRELVQRWMLEDMRRQPVLTSPNIVRDYLAVHYAGQEREVFGVLFLDNRHRLIAARGDVPGHRRRRLGASPRGREAGAQAQRRRGDPRAQPSRAASRSRVRRMS
jgi:DNA repair protein RadC